MARLVSRRVRSALLTGKPSAPACDPANDAAYHMSGGGLGDWFDASIYQQQVTPDPTAATNLSDALSVTTGH